MLRGEGLRAGIERFGEFANILFLKLISESEQIKRESGIPTKFDVACSWDSIKQIPISTRIEYINKTVYDKLNALYDTDIFTPLQIRDASILKEIMDKLDPLMLTDVDSDVKGDAFEYFLKASTSTKNDLGEYFTPRHIVKTMVRLVNPQIGEKIYDPFCGTGGFLIESFRYTRNEMAHASGKFDILTEEIFEAKANSILNSMKNIHKCMDKPIRKWYGQVLLSFCKGEFDGYDDPKDVIIEQMIQTFKLSTNELLICNEMSINGLITEHRGYQTKLRDFKKSVSDHCLEMGYK